MTEFEVPPPLDKSTMLETLKKYITKKVLIIITGLVLVSGGIVGVSNFQDAVKFNDFISEVKVLIEKDMLDQAETLLVSQEDSYKEKTDFVSLKANLKQLVTSKADFASGESDFSNGDYIDAINYYKKVKELDETRYEKARTKIEEASNLAVTEAIERATELKAKNSYIEALSALNKVSSFASGSTQFKSLKDELGPLASEQAKKEEAAKNAKYLSALRSMRISRDKFNNYSFYYDRTTPYYADNNKFFLYIGQAPGSDPYLRMELRYSDDDWLFVDYAEINIDGSVYEFDISSSEWETDNGSGDIWEWADVTPTNSHLSIIDKVINSKSAIIRFTGSKYRDDVTVSSTQKRAFVNVLNAFEALKKGLGK
jgi:hypothetical protein